MASGTVTLVLSCLAVATLAFPQTRSRVVPLAARGQVEEAKETGYSIVIPTADESKATKVFQTQQHQAVRSGSKYAEEEDELFRKQAESAKYSFETSIDDGIMGHAHSRTEVRDGLKVEGMYSYSDGFYKRTIQYEADDKGYRVVKETVEPIGDGPVIDLGGEAVVRTSLGTDYKITVDDLRKLNVKSDEKRD